MAEMGSALVVVSVLLVGLLAEGATAKQPAKLMLMRSVSANKRHRRPGQRQQGDRPDASDGGQWKRHRLEG
jgi:hypothetical protein